MPYVAGGENKYPNRVGIHARNVIDFLLGNEEHWNTIFKFIIIGKVKDEEE